VRDCSRAARLTPAAPVLQLLPAPARPPDRHHRSPGRHHDGQGETRADWSRFGKRRRRRSAGRQLAPRDEPPPPGRRPPLPQPLLLLPLAGLLLASSAAAATTTVVHWGFPHAPRPRLTLAPGDALTFEWAAEHGVYLIPATKAGKTPTCEDGAGFKDAGLVLAQAPRRADYGPVAGTLTWTAAAPGTYAFADPVASNCGAGMLLIVDVAAPKGAAASPAPLPALAASGLAAPAAPAPAPSLAETATTARARAAERAAERAAARADRRVSTASAVPRAERDGAPHAAAG